MSFDVDDLDIDNGLSDLELGNYELENNDLDLFGSNFTSPINAKAETTLPGEINAERSRDNSSRVSRELGSCKIKELISY